MIISRTPFRISFAGGGTDIGAYYRRSPGCVISTAIDKYMFISVHKPFDNRIRLKYSHTEEVDSVSEIKHPIIREVLRMLSIVSGIEITSVSDIPARAGLGSSSSFTVGLLNAIHAFKGEHVSAETLAREACEIEINRLGEPIGKQDQYIAAYGGLQFIKFNSDETVFVDPVICAQEYKSKFVKHLMLFHCSGTRAARDILEGQTKNIPDRMQELASMVKLAEDMKRVISSGGDIAELGRLMHENWLLKKGMADNITNPEIEGWYDRAIQAGAYGGKLLGAGGGGFLLFCAAPGRQNAVREALSYLRPIPFSLEPQGSKIIYVG